MDTSKIKNILILILAALNLFLLAAVISDRAEKRENRLTAVEAAVAAVENSGIHVADTVDADLPDPAVYTLRRDMDRERSLMKNLLGRAGVSDLGGNIFFYSSDRGQVSARGTGELDLLITDGSYSGSDKLKTAEKVMSRLGLDCSGGTAEVLDHDMTNIELCCLWNGGTVYNAKMSFTFSGNNLVIASGTRLLDNASVDAGTATLDVLTVMMRFLETVEREGIVCSELRGIDTGYIVSATVSGESTLTPVWHFTTDAGNIYINAVTGGTESLG